SRLLNTLEAVFGISIVVLLILVVNKNGLSNNPLFCVLSVIFLLGYYLAWVFYYRGVVHPWLLIIGIAGMPPLYFLCAGLWLNNLTVVIPCLIFGLVHVCITCSTYLT
ncbi:MAG: hypothetical protein LWX83_16240, partial [Anaerolineae bacterium]|nr:hypothetical protein [Anaerolineae bacterium]